MKSWLIAPLSTLAVTLVPAVANALTLTWTPAPSVTSISTLPTDFIPPKTSTPLIPKFDPVAVLAAQPPAPPGIVYTGVSLVGVSVNYESTINTSAIRFENLGGTVDSGSFFGDYQKISFDGPGTGLDVPLGGVGFTDISGTSLPIPIGGSSNIIDPPAQTRTFSKSTSAASDLLAFTAPGSFAFDVFADVNLFYEDPNGGIRPVLPGFTDLNFKATVSYKYEVDFRREDIDTVPEPSSLLGLGLLGLGLGSTVLRKKKTA
jgi:hypothetical protein